MIAAVKISTAALVLFSSLASLAGAVEPEQKEEAASTKLVITLPDDGSVFVDILRSHRSQKDEDRPFEWKEVDEKIDKWFTEAETRFPEDFKKHAGNWAALREQSRQDARAALNPVEEAWKDSVNLTAIKFEASEADFYASNPTLLIRGTYRYFEGKRDISGVEPSWELNHADLVNAPSIQGEDNYETGEIVIKAAGMDHPMFNLKCAWNFSLKASIDPESLDARAIGAVNTPNVWVAVDPRFNGESNRKVTLSWGYYDKTITPIGPVKLTIGDTRISTSLGLGTGFTYGALDSGAPRPKLKAGVNDPAMIE